MKTLAEYHVYNHCVIGEKNIYRYTHQATGIFEKRAPGLLRDHFGSCSTLLQEVFGTLKNSCFDMTCIKYYRSFIIVIVLLLLSSSLLLLLLFDKWDQLYLLLGSFFLIARFVVRVGESGLSGLYT